MSETEKTFKNFFYQFGYKIITLLIPFFVSPYLTRTLGDSALGNYTYIFSIVTYFAIIANLGISKHGQRIIATNSSNEQAIRKIFWSLFFAHCIFSILAIIIYVTFLAIFVKENLELYIIIGFYILSVLLDVTWFFYGLQNFKIVVLWNIIVKVLECILIFALIKKPEDVIYYAIIVMASTLLGQVAIFFTAIKHYPIISISFADVKQHIGPLFLFSISVVAVTLYTVFDKTLLGIMTTKENVAYYEYSHRIIELPINFIAVFGAVMFPKACSMVSENNKSEQKKYLKISLLGVSAIGFASLFGLLAIAEQFSIIYYGNDFAPCGKIIMCMSALPLIVGLADIVRTQYMIPNHMDKQYIICIVINAIINVVLSVTLIPFLGVYGAVIGTVCAELFGTIYQIILSKEIINIKMIFKNCIPFIIIGGIMFGIVKIFQYFLSTSWISLIIEVVVAGLVYILLSLLYIKIFQKDLLSLLKKNN